MSDREEVEIITGAEEELPAAQWTEVIGDEDELREVADRLCKEYRKARAARAEKEATWAKWRRQFEARPSKSRKNYPYPNASNVSPPLSQMIGQDIFGYLKGMYDAIDPPWYIEALRQEDRQLIKEAEIATRYFNVISKSRLDLNMSKFKRDFLQEVGIMGTCFAKVPWTSQPWHFMSEEDGVEQSVSAMLHDGPELIVIPVEDVVYPENYTDIQTMPWIAHDVSKAEYELRDLAAMGVYDSDAVEQVINGTDRLPQSARTNTEDEVNQSSPDRKGEYALSEVYFYHDADGDGVYEDIVFTLHVPTGTVLRQDYNRFGYRMLTAGRFISRIFSLEGRGSGQTTEYQQDEIEGIHNVRNDNMKFSNMRMLAVRRGVMRENEALSPGKIFITDSPKEDINPIQLGEVYPSSLAAENQTVSYARQASGVSSTMSGFADPTLGTRDTYRGQAQRQQQGTSLFTTIAEGLNDCFSEIGMMLFFQLVHNKDRVIANERRMKRMSEEDIEVLESTLSIDVQDIPSRLAFHIRTSDVDETYEAKRQNMLSLTQLYSQFAEQQTPLAMMLFGQQGRMMQQQSPEAYKYLLSIYVGSTQLMSEVFKFMGEDDPMQYVPDTKKQKFMLDMMNRMSGQMVDRLKGVSEGVQQMSAGQMNGSGPAPGMGIGAGGPPQGGGPAQGEVGPMAPLSEEESGEVE